MTLLACATEPATCLTIESGGFCYPKKTHVASDQLAVENAPAVVQVLMARHDGGRRAAHAGAASVQSDLLDTGCTIHFCRKTAADAPLQRGQVYREVP